MLRASKRWTYDDLALLPEDGHRHEIIDGKHYLHESPDTKHQRVSLHFILEIGTYLRDYPVGQLYHALLDVVLSQYDVVEPDLMFITNERREIITVKNIQGAPDLLVEILSHSNESHDEVTKHALYERTGVGEYWIVDPARNIVRVFHRNAAGRYEQVAELSENDTLTSPLFPTLEIHLQRVFSD
jgi:Uma2 family endonuclease